MLKSTCKKAVVSAIGALLAVPAVAGVASAAPVEPVGAPQSTEIASEFTWVDKAAARNVLGEMSAIGGLATKSSGRWIEYNLSNYCLYLHEGDSVVFKTCSTSSGKKGHGTPAGNFKVYKKAAGPICMQPPGDDKVCNIHYATYWGRGGYAFHEAWWMGGRVNQRISHGCVNMRLGDAQTVFNFASIGTPVNIHW